MARIEVVHFECDWCKDRLPAVVTSNDEELPHGWKEVEYSTLCLDCQKVRTDAIAEVRHRRLNKDRMPSWTYYEHGQAERKKAIEECLAIASKYVDQGFHWTNIPGELRALLQSSTGEKP